MKRFLKKLTKRVSALSGNTAFMMRLLSFIPRQGFLFAGLYLVDLDTHHQLGKKVRLVVARALVIAERNG
tara:strand:+ start:220 stop:429 length:210 start_codon:yes stop_codon:yes gene_type:complete